MRRLFVVEGAEFTAEIAENAELGFTAEFTEFTEKEQNTTSIDWVGKYELVEQVLYIVPRQQQSAG